MEKQKEKKNWNKIWVGLLPVLFGAVIGVIFGTMMIRTERRGDSVVDFVVIYCVLMAVLISMIFHIVIHEAGHLLFGLLSGYRFVSFRIGSLTLVHVNHQWKLKRFNIPGTGGQCLMAPPKLDEQGDYPARLYNLGGILVNLVASLLFTLLAVLCKESTVLRSVWIAFAGMGYFIFITNGIPMKISGIANDGYNLFSIDKDPVGKRCFYLQLELNARLSDGESLKDMSFEEICVPETTDITNPLIAAAKMFEYYWYAQREEFDQACAVLKQFEPVWDKMIPLLRNMLAMERIYVAILGLEPRETIDDLLTKEVKAYMKNAKYDVHVNRVSYGLALMQDPSSDQTEKAKEKFLKVVKNSPVCGEAELSLELEEYMEKKLAEDFS